MVVTVKLGGPLREKLPGHVAGELSLELEQGAWVSQAIHSLGVGADDVAIMMLHGRSLSADKVLTAGDRLALFSRSQAFSTIAVMNYYNPLAGKILNKNPKKLT